MSSTDRSPQDFAPDWAHGERYRVDMRKLLEAYVAVHPQPLERLAVADARRRPTLADVAADVVGRDVDAEVEWGVLAHDLTIPGAQGRLPVRVYTPHPVNCDPYPLIIYWHGGGWVLGDLERCDASPRTIAKLTQCIVVSCAYRRAPEHRFPAAHDDALAAYTWVVEHADSLGGDAERIATMGECSGANLACAVAGMARARGWPLPRHMALVCPIAGRLTESASRREHMAARPIGTATVDWWLAQAHDLPADAVDPRIDLLAADLRDRPPTTLVTAEIDPLRSDGDALAARLREHGVAVRHRCFQGVTHDFFGLGLFVTEAAVAETWVARELRRALGTVIDPS